jgi:hypothetical protein
VVAIAINMAKIVFLISSKITVSCLLCYGTVTTLVPMKSDARLHDGRKIPFLVKRIRGETRRAFVSVQSSPPRTVRRLTVKLNEPDATWLFTVCF